MKIRTQGRNSSLRGFKWDFFNQSLALALIILGLLTSVSLFDYARGTFTRTSTEGIQTITSDAPLTALHIMTTFATDFDNWVEGRTGYEKAQTSLALLDYRLKRISGLSTSLADFITPEFTASLNRLRATMDKYANQTLTNNQREAIFAQSLDDLRFIESFGFIASRDYFRVIADGFEAGSASQFKRAQRTMVFFIGFLILTFLLAMRIIKSQLKAIELEKQVEAQNAKTLQEVSTQLLEARASVKDISNLSVSNNDYLSTVNHELRTPLTSIIGYLDLLRDIKTVDQDYEFAMYLGVMDRNASVLLDIIEDILIMSRYESENVHAEFVKIDLVEECLEQVAELELSLSEKNTKVNFIHEDDGYFVAADKIQIHQVLRNLLSNAIKYSPQDTIINMSLSRKSLDVDDKVIELNISDQGIGIPPAELEKIFDKFYRASNSDSDGAKGTGLGLTIVKNILTRFGGQIWAHSVVNQGTTFTVQIPEYLDATERMILDNRGAVLERAIAALAGSELEDLAPAAHEFGGAIGFYHFADESRELLEFSHWLKANAHGNSEIVAEKRKRILTQLRSTLESINSAKDM